jgi:phosphoribosylanthranilate isomerase
MAFEIRFPKIKFCGLTRAEDVTAAIACGANAIGLNFYRASPRYIAPAAARELGEIALRARVKGENVMRVGVFVNATPSEVSEILSLCPLDCIQLHGDESTGWLEGSLDFPALQTIRFIKAIAWRGCQEDQEIARDWNSVTDPRLLGLLVDAYDPIQRGGTGKTARWDLLFPRPIELKRFPILLAGGLTLENLAHALEIARPDGIDVASGIEVRPGIKDHSKMLAVGDIARQFLLNCL